MFIQPAFRDKDDPPLNLKIPALSDLHFEIYLLNQDRQPNILSYIETIPTVFLYTQRALNCLSWLF